MTCSECQVQIFEDELDRDAAVHLRSCDECRAVHQEARLNALALASMKDEVMPVRSRRRWPWLVATAAAVLVAVGIAYRPMSVERPVQVAVVPPLPVAPVMPKPVPARPVPVRRIRPAKPAPPTEPMLVKFLTDDPDVVIYWLIDSQGEQTL